jgi:hypothetical protein
VPALLIPASHDRMPSGNNLGKLQPGIIELSTFDNFALRGRFRLSGRF